MPDRYEFKGLMFRVAPPRPPGYEFFPGPHFAQLSMWVLDEDVKRLDYLYDLVLMDCGLNIWPLDERPPFPLL